MNWEMDAMEDMDRGDDKEEMRAPYEIEKDNMLQEENNRSLDAENAMRDAAKAKAKTPAELVKAYRDAVAMTEADRSPPVGWVKAEEDAALSALLAAIPKPPLVWTEDHQEALELWFMHIEASDRCEAGGNDGADVHDATEAYKHAVELTRKIFAGPIQPPQGAT